MRKLGLEIWIQIIASIGVIVGLALVAYELRENRLFAMAEANRSMISEWANISRAQFESDIFEIYVTSFEDPESLSSAEMLKLGSWLTSTVGMFDLQYRMYELGLAEDPTQDLIGDFQYYLGSRFARAWFAENKHWLSPQLVQLIEREIELQSADDTPAYIESLRSRIAKNEDSESN